MAAIRRRPYRPYRVRHRVPLQRQAAARRGHADRLGRRRAQGGRRAGHRHGYTRSAETQLRQPRCPQVVERHREGERASTARMVGDDCRVEGEPEEAGTIARGALDRVRARPLGQPRPADDPEGRLQHRAPVHDASPDQQRRTDEIEDINRAVDALQAWVSLSGAASVVLPQIYQFAEDEPAFAKIAAELRTTLDLLEAFGVASDSVVLQPDLNRIWDYYSGIVFELRTPDGQSLGGGGRYDGLLRLLGNPVDAPAVGFQVNVDAIIKRFGHEIVSLDAVVLIGGRSHAPHVFEWAVGLRAHGVVCEVIEDESGYSQTAVRIDQEGAHVGERRFSQGQVKELAAYLQERTIL